MSEDHRASRIHAITSASSSSQWLNCSGSCALSLECQLPETDEAAEGTIAHGWVEEVLPYRRDEESISRVLLECPDMQMVQGAKGMCALVNGIEDRIGKFDAEYVEKRIKLNDRIYGKADFSAICGNRGVFVDFKYGMGIPVAAKNNSQLACYATSFRKTMDIDFERVDVFIYQPRAWDNEQEDVKHWKMNRELLDYWEKKLIAASDVAYNVLIGRESPTYKLGSWCQFCDGKPRCGAIGDKLREYGLLNA